MNVGERIKYMRLELNMSQEQLAKKAGYSGKAAISKLEHSGDDITLKQIKRVASALSIQTEYLLGWSDNPYQLPLFEIEPQTDKKGYVLGVRHDPPDPYKEPTYNVNAEEYEIIQKYRIVSDEIKAIVQQALETGCESYRKRKQKESENLPPLDDSPFNWLNGN